MKQTVEKEPAGEINRLHFELQSLAADALDRAIRIGDLLCSQKGTIGHGKWLPWLKANVSFSERTASNYMSVFRNRERLKSANAADLSLAYRLLSAEAGAVRSVDMEGHPKMGLAEATILHREVVAGLRRIYADIEEFADWPCEAQAEIRQRVGGEFLPVLVLDKVAALVKDNVDRETIPHEVFYFIIKHLLKTADPNLDVEALFADGPGIPV